MQRVIETPFVLRFGYQRYPPAVSWANNWFWLTHQKAHPTWTGDGGGGARAI
jgi:hypothetical protein